MNIGTDGSDSLRPMLPLNKECDGPRVCTAIGSNNVEVHNRNMLRLTTGICSEKWVVRRFRRCANVIDCTYTDLDTMTYYTQSIR